MSENIIVGLFAVNSREQQKVMHGVLPLDYGLFYANLVARRYLTDWTIYVEDEEGTVHGSMRGRKKHDSPSSEVQDGRVRKLRNKSAAGNNLRG